MYAINISQGLLRLNVIIMYMTKNPFLNAIAATVYIVLVAGVMFYGTKFAPNNNSILAPIALVSLFTLSTAVMGYLFCYQPGILYFDGQKKQAVKLFLQTVGVFGGITFFVLILLFIGVLS